MAKKGGPQKVCPKCNKTVHARVRECKCGHVFTFKEKREKPQKDTSEGMSLKRALPTITEMGGVKAVAKMIEQYNTLTSELKRLGGVQSAEDLLAEINELKEALK